MSDALADGFAELDRIAALLVVRVQPVRFAVAGTAEERSAAFRLRCQAVIDRGWGRPEDFPGGEERDQDDDRAVHLVGWDETVPIAAARLIFPSTDAPFPVEDVFRLNLEPRGELVHVDRLTVARAHADPSSRMFLALIAACWIESRAHGFHTWIGIDSEPMIRLYRRLGFTMTILGPARIYWDEPRYPVRFDPAPNTRELSRRLASRAR